MIDGLQSHRCKFAKGKWERAPKSRRGLVGFSDPVAETGVIYTEVDIFEPITGWTCKEFTLGKYWLTWWQVHNLAHGPP